MFVRQHGHMQRGLPSVLGGLTTLLSLVATVYAAPLIWPLVEGYVWNSLIGLYGPDWTFWLYWFAKFGLYPLVFVIVRAALSAVFVAALLAAAKRLI